MKLEAHSHLAISLLCIICDRDKRERVETLLKKHDAFFSLITYGHGTANSRILNYLGLGETEKAVFLSIMTADIACQASEAIDEKLELKKPGHGISFTAKLHQGCYHKPVEFVGGANGGVTMQQESAHNLIMVVLNRGYSEEVMDAARAAGARGGTVLHARGFGAAATEKFFGISISPEKEILLIVAQDDGSQAIMAGIAEKVGPSTDACAISFALPVNCIRGIQTAKIV